MSRGDASAYFSLQNITKKRQKLQLATKADME